MKLPPLRFTILLAAVVCASPVWKAQADLRAYEPFDYTAVTGTDHNEDGKKDLMGLAGGLGWSGGWREETGFNGDDALLTEPLDFVNDFDVAHPSGDPRFSSGGPGSVTLSSYTAAEKPTQSASILFRDFAEPFLFSETTTIWLSVLLRKDRGGTPSNGATRVSDAFEIGLVRADGAGVFMGDIFDGNNTLAKNEFGLRQVNTDYTYLTGSSLAVGQTDFLVMKLSISAGVSRVEFFLNPSLDTLAPVPDLSMPMSSTAINSEFTGVKMISSPSRTVWSVDEIRVGETYAQVVPEPSSLLLTGLGMAMLGGARLRRSRAGQN